MIGYYINSTAGRELTTPVPGMAAAAGSSLTGTQTVYVTSSGPHVTCVNLTMALGMGTAFGWGPTQNNPYNWQNGVMWTVPLPNATDDGTPISSALS